MSLSKPYPFLVPLFSLFLGCLAVDSFGQQGLRFAVVRAPKAHFGQLWLTHSEGSKRAVSLTRDEHAPDLAGDSVQSNLVLVQAGFSVRLPDASKGRLMLIEPGVSSVPLKAESVVNACAAPAGVAQASWRTGMATPTVLPDTNIVTHLIVHHSATDNSLTDYVGVVRAIYLLHTQTNGWDDIGYNYLIAPDGTLFLGRDPQGRCHQDNVKGAHYCGKNAATMGVCLLGNFMTEAPTLAALSSLKQLLGWKMAQEGFTSSTFTLHPPGLSTATPLAGIAGHRDGCSTECPGDFVYQGLDLIKAGADSLDAVCAAPTATARRMQAKAHFASRQAGQLQGIGALPSQSWTLFTTDGRLAGHGQADKTGEISIANLRRGLYLVVLEGASAQRVVVE